MAAVRGGDLAAFEEIVRRHQVAVFRFACRILGDEAQAEDVAQTTFLKLLAAAPRYRPTARLRTFLYTIAGRLCMDHFRKRRHTTIVEPPDRPDPDPGPEEILVASERAHRIRTALATLPERQRVALVLRHFDGLGYAEIAEVLGVSVKAVERLLSRARGALAVRLKDLTAL